MPSLTPDQINTLDKSRVFASIQKLPDQIDHTYQSLAGFTVDPEFSRIRRIVVAGMGGSALGAKVIKTVYQDTLSLPLEIVNHYRLPAYVDADTLVILSSYSGTTEEVLAAAKEAQTKQAKIVSLSAGGTLAELAQAQGWPHLTIDPVHNPSGQPRMAIGYAIFAQMVLLDKLGLISLNSSLIRHIVARLQSDAKQLETLAPGNPAYDLAQAALEKDILLVSAEHLAGPVHVFNNQINENAKHMTAELVIPEMNHHFLEALKFPQAASQHHHFVFFASRHYHPGVQKRVELTQKIVTEKGYTATLIDQPQADKLEEAMSVIQLGAYANFYLAILHGIDPAPIPTVDYFKAELKRGL